MMIRRLFNLFWFGVSLLIILSLFSKNIFAALKLNEIYPAPPAGEYEWVELYNDEDKILNISNYQLLDLAGNKIKFSAISVLPLNFILATSSSILNNNGDTIFLKNNSGEIIEIATYSGSFDSTKNFAKCPDGSGNWLTLNLPTKNTSNQTACQSLTPTLTPTPISSAIPSPTPTPTLEPQPTPSPTPIAYSNVFISEAMAYPPSGSNEWVEIYNGNDFSVSLVDWYLDDIENAGSSPKMFSLDIQSKSYAVFELSSSMLNNTGDSVRLLDFNKNLKDSFEYQSSQQGKTWGRVSFDADEFCLQEPSKGTNNNTCINPTPTPQPTPTKTPTKIPSPTLILTPIQSVLMSRPTSRIPFQLGERGIIESNSQGEILGLSERIIKNKNPNKPLVQSLSFLSFSYALLTIISIILKIKFSLFKSLLLK